MTNFKTDATDNRLDAWIGVPATRLTDAIPLCRDDASPIYQVTRSDFELG
jgi:hypothetical protein